jgi:cytochrome c-type biogenesis protein CcmE
MKPKQQRLILGVVALVAVVGAGFLAAAGLRNTASFFYTPAQARAATIAPGTAVRLGGMVEAGSIQRAADGVTVTFRLTDGQATIPVRFTGIVPDLFAEGQGAVSDGRFDANGTFIADDILAKHDERYMPPHMGEIPKNAGQSLDTDTVSRAAPAETAR